MTPPYSSQSNRIAKRKNNTLTELIDTMLKKERLSKKRLNLSYLHTCGCLTKVNVLINKKLKLGLKTVNYVFLGYAIHGVEVLNNKLWST